MGAFRSGCFIHESWEILFHWDKSVGIITESCCNILMFLVWLAPLVLLVSSAYPATNGGYPACSENIFNLQGNLDIYAMFTNCTKTMSGSLFPPSYFPNPLTGNYAPLNVSINIAINNLISVDDLTFEVSLDFWFRNYWQDPRIYLPDMWQYLNPAVAGGGLDITQYVRNLANPVNFWLPDIIFFEGTEYTVPFVLHSHHHLYTLPRLVLVVLV